MNTAERKAFNALVDGCFAALNMEYAATVGAAGTGLDVPYHYRRIRAALDMVALSPDTERVMHIKQW